MGQTLNSWQEIASYVGKGLRTVQRWEREIDFPVHRAGDDSRRVIGFTDEINDWMHRSQTLATSRTDVHRSIEARNAQVARLREQVLRAQEQAAILKDRVARLTANRATREIVREEELAIMQTGRT